MIFFVSEEPYRVTDLLPGNDMAQQLPIIFFLIIGTGILAVGIGYFLSPLLLKFHYKVIGRKLTYGIQELREPENYKRRFYAFLPALLSVSLSMILADNETVLNIIVSQELIDQLGSASHGLAVLWSFLILLPLTSIISLTIFPSIWYLLESGIIYSNRNKVKDKMRSEKIDGVGNWYYKTVKDLVGIGAIISYFRFIFNTFLAYDPDISILESGALGALIFLPLLPFMVMFFFTPGMIIFNHTIEKRRQNLIELAKKMQINQDLRELLQ